MSSKLHRLVERRLAAAHRAISTFAANGACDAYNAAIRWMDAYGLAISKRQCVQPSLPLTARGAAFLRAEGVKGVPQ
jgi:hypothetical protein